MIQPRVYRVNYVVYIFIILICYHIYNQYLVTLSYHISAADDIKCYLLWQGSSQRFYPQDIVEILPRLFVCDERDTFKNKEFSKSVEIQRLAAKMKIVDTKFEEFYRSVNRLNEKDFPKQYNLPPQKFHGQAIVSPQDFNISLQNDVQEDQDQDPNIVDPDVAAETEEYKEEETKFALKLSKALKQELEEIINTYYDTLQNKDTNDVSTILNGMLCACYVT